MKIAVCGIGCEKCHKMIKGQRPNKDAGCKPRDNQFCKICICAFQKGVKLCCACPDSPARLQNQGLLVTVIAPICMVKSKP